MLRARLLGMTDAILRISADLDLDKVLQEVTDSARKLTGARYAAIATFDEAGELQDWLASGLSDHDRDKLLSFGAGVELSKHLSQQRDSVRDTDLVAYADAAGFSGLQVPIGAFVSAQIRVGDVQVGTICIAEKHDDSEFTAEDEEILEIFASQAASALNNAHRYSDEQQGKADLEALVNTSPVGVFVVDAPTGDVSLVNAEARRLLRLDADQDGFSAASLRRLSFTRMDGSDIAYEDLPFERARREGETVRAEGLVIVRPDGSEAATLVNATPIRSGDGELRTVMAIFQDMSPLEDLERMRAEFLAMVSHELRAPLTSIKGVAATMRGMLVPPDPAEVRQFFSIVEEQADHMRDLISDLQDMTRIEAGTFSLKLDPVGVDAVVEHAKSAFLSGGYRHSVDIESMSSLPRVWGDRQRLMQVLLNLFTNAAASSRDWSTIGVSASLEDNYVAVTVTDEGAGIAPERLPQLFTKFSQGKSSEPGRSDGGYGLRLAICRGIVEAHGGRIWALSAGDGRGAQITFTIPAVDAAANETASSERRGVDSLRAASRAERILVLDDDPQALRFIRTTLSREGYAAIATSDPGEVEHLLDAEMPHLVLLDLVLPGADGFELIRRIPKILEVPVIFVSGRSDEKQIGKAFELGASDYIVKPFSPTELLARINAALRRREQTQHAETYRLGDLAVDYLTRTVTVAGQAVKLTPTEYKLLSGLCINAGRALSYEQLLDLVWGDAEGGDAQRVRTFIKDLRAKLGDDARNPTYILTVPNVGYRAPAL